MISDYLLRPVYDAYIVASECFNVVDKIIRDQNAAFMHELPFTRETPQDAVVALQRARQQAADLAVLALFATFERMLIEQLQTARAWLALGRPVSYAARLADKFGKEVEYWRFHDVMDLFKPEVDVDLIGRAKQIKQYRDWIAHRNPSKPAPSVVTPELTFRVLSGLIEQIRDAHVSTSSIEA
ncbi:hypothetical protein [Cupriavidus plantarum]|uniref:RiboL-PSP-HEPN domain-containing protein n=1 Tax=Cupriavidus plantarum TaxID=942865 RepID=A0A316EK56_9BURK|nr:hypothetical protein [Cupriavidus plantarum]PWK31650.1 hypothetical protein C7419_109107 [Cupriavidus plantarum]CAG2145565.1 hypothetical protein LMG26296_03768 [Cupriavidus plantarum]SMR86741.1 hypothetical protein SAMN05421735_5579 [Cupriavidus plantarum]